MKYWLVKSEQSCWSWNDQVKAGAKGTAWTEVRNHLAKKHLQTMKKDDQCFFYHSNEGKDIVGIVEVIREAYPDPTDESGKFFAVDVRAVNSMQKPITLGDIKKVESLAKMSLLNSARLSVQPVTAAEWKTICKMGGL
ncbi:MAG: EVE domain-containing protein [Pseudomonadota bacterium]